MLLILGLAIVAVMAIVIFLSPFAGLLLYMSWFMVRPQEFIIGLGGTLPLERILALAAIGSSILHLKLLKPRQLISSPITHALLAFLAVNYLSLASSIWKTNTLDTANELGKGIIFYYLMIILIDDSNKLRKSLWLFLLCTAWIAGSSIYNYYTNPYYAQGIHRATSLTLTYGDPNATASSLARAMPFLFALLGLTRGWWQRIVLVSFLALYLMAIVFTGSRAGVVQVVVAFLLVGLFSRRRWLVLPLCFLILTLAWVLTPAEYQKRYKTTLAFAGDLESGRQPKDESAYGRIVGWKVSVQIFKDHPILGVGAGNFAAAFWGLNYSYEGRKGWFQPHNLPGQLISELGTLGAISFLFLNFTIVRTARAVRHTLRSLRSPPALPLAVSQAVLMTLILLFVGGFSAHNLYSYSWYMAGAFAVVSLRLARQDQKDVTDAREPQPLSQIALR
jgi:O-antigen ligase